jgi:hypothetical protein
VGCNFRLHQYNKMHKHEENCGFVVLFQLRIEKEVQKLTVASSNSEVLICNH